MEKINEIIKVIEKITRLEDIEFVDSDGDTYKFVGYNYDDNEEVEIEVIVDDEFVAIKKIRRKVK